MLHACVREEAPSYIIVAGFEVLTTANMKSAVIVCSWRESPTFRRIIISFVFKI
jgi:hypothetical protein